MQPNDNANMQNSHVAGAAVGPLRRAVLVTMAVGLAVTLALSNTRTTRANDDEAAADLPEAACSNATLHGDYASTLTGTVFAGPNQIVLRGVVMNHFDGHGNSTQVDFVTHNGVPESSDWRPATGTYQINPDCTGTREIHFADGEPPLHVRIVVADHGRRFEAALENAAVGGSATKVR
jgi:hypothetical protein